MRWLNPGRRVCMVSVLGLAAAWSPTTWGHPCPDVDADGIGDVVQSAPDSLQILSGASGAPLRTIPGPAGSGFGAAWACIEDVDADGVPDLIVLAPSLQQDGSVVGSISAVSAGASAVIWTMPGRTDLRLGTTLGVLTDQDGDGIAELAVNVVTGPSGPDRTLIVSGRSGRWLAGRDGSVADVLAADADGIPIYIPEDLDDSGIVDTNDLALWLDAFTHEAPGGDVNNDGVVNMADAVQIVAAMEANTTGYQAGLRHGLPWGPDDPSEPDACRCVSILGGGSPLLAPTCSTSISYTWQPDGSIHCVVPDAGADAEYCWGSGNTGPAGSGREFDVFPTPSLAEYTLCIRVGVKTIVNGEPCVACDSVCITIPPSCFTDVHLLAPACDDLLGQAIRGEVVGFEAHGEPAGGAYHWFISVLLPPGHSPAEIPWSFTQPADARILVLLPDLPVHYGLKVKVCYDTENCLQTCDSCVLDMPTVGDEDGDGLPDQRELPHGTGCPDISNPDSDNDGFRDGDEVRLGSDPCDANSTPIVSQDTDRDGVPDVYEWMRNQSSPFEYDSDGDGVPDLAELELKLDPMNVRTASVHDSLRPEWRAQDRDFDGIYDPYEAAHGWDPSNPDQDGDGIRDGIELKYHLDPERPDQGPGSGEPWIDTDGDGLTDAVEMRMGLLPNRPDSDGDGLNDGEEARLGYDPLSHDSNHDGVDDGDEDFDGDGLSNRDEQTLGSDPADPDTNHNGQCDRQDVEEGLDPAANESYRPGYVVVRCPHSDTFEIRELFVHARAVTCSGIARDGSYWSLTGAEVVPVSRGSATSPCAIREVATPFKPGAEYEFKQHGVCPSSLFVRAWPWVEPADVQGTECSHGVAADVIQVTQTQVHANRCGGDDIFTTSWVFPPDHPVPVGGSTDPSGPPNLDWNTDGDPNGPANFHIDRPTVRLFIDSDNNDGFERPDMSDAEKAANDDATKPGKIIFASTFDSDGDGIPDFADGFNLFGDRLPDGSPSGPTGTEETPGRTKGAKRRPDYTELDNTSEGANFVPMVVRVSGAYSASSTITFTYDGSDPALVGHTPSDAFTRPTGGNLRIWALVLPDQASPTTPGSPSLNAHVMPQASFAGGTPPCDRSPFPTRTVAERNDTATWTYLKPGKPYRLDRLRLSSGQCTFWVEAVRAGSVARQSINAVVDGSNVGGSLSEPANVRLTAYEREWRPVRPDGSLGPASFMPEVADPMPVFRLSVDPSGAVGDFVIQEVRPRADDPAQLEAVVQLHGTIQDTLLDHSAELAGTQPTFGALINDYAIPSGHPPGDGGLTVSWAEEPAQTSVLRPFPRTGAINGTIRVPVIAGHNSLFLTAANTVHKFGVAEIGFDIEATPPEDVRFEIEVNLISGDIFGEPGSTVALTLRHGPESGPMSEPATHILTPTGVPCTFSGAGITLRLHVGAGDGLIAQVQSGLLPEGEWSCQTVPDASDPFVFRGERTITSEERISWAGYTLRVQATSVSFTHKTAVTPPTGFELLIAGPSPSLLLQMADQVSLNGHVFDLKPSTESGTLVLTPLDRDLPAVFFALSDDSLRFSPFLTDFPEPTIVPWAPTQNGVGPFLKGVAVGLWDGTVVSLWHDGKSIVPMIWHVVRDYNPASQTWRLIRQGRVLTKSDEESFVNALTGAFQLADFSEELIRDELDVIYASLNGEGHLALAKIPFARRKYAIIALEMYEALIAEVEGLEDLDDFERGRIVGRITGEVIKEIAIFIATEGIGNVVERAKIVSKVAETATSAGSNIQRGLRIPVKSPLAPRKQAIFDALKKLKDVARVKVTDVSLEADYVNIFRSIKARGLRGYEALEEALLVIDQHAGGRVAGKPIRELISEAQADAITRYLETGDHAHLRDYSELAEDLVLARQKVSGLQTHHPYGKAEVLEEIELRLGRAATAAEQRALDRMPSIIMKVEDHQKLTQMVASEVRLIDAELRGAERAQALRAATRKATADFNALFGKSAARPHAPDYSAMLRAAEEFVDQEFFP